MPTVQRYDGNVREAALPAVRKSATPGLEAFGGGASLEKLTNAGLGLIDKGGDIFEKEMKEQKKQADQVAFMGADQKLSELETATQIEVQKMRGENALGAPEYVTDKWKKGVDEVRKGLVNDDQRMAFDRSSASRYDSLNRNTSMHVAKQAEALDDEKTKGYLESAKNAATLNASDPNRVAQEIQRTQGATADWLKRKGIPVGSDAHQVEMTKATSPIYSAVINRLIVDNQTPQAKQYFDQVKDQMDQDDRDKVKKFLEHSSVLSQAQVAAKDIATRHSSMASAMKDIDKIKDPEVQEKAKHLVDERLTLMKQAKKEYKDNLYETMAKEMEKSKDFLKIQTDPRWLQLDANQRNAMENRWDSFVHGTDRVTDKPAWLEFQDLSWDKLSSMSAADIDVKYISKFSKEDAREAKKTMEERRKSVEKGPSLTELTPGKEQIDSVLERTFGKEKKDFNDAQRGVQADFLKRTQKALSDFEITKLDGKRKATPEERQSIIDDVVLKDRATFKKGFFSTDEKPIVLMTPSEKESARVTYEKIPSNVVQTWAKEYRNRGISVTPTEKARMEKAYAEFLMSRDKQKVEQILFQR